MSAPRAATWLLERFLADQEKDAVIGDLTEEYSLLARDCSEPNASRWYWSQVWRSLPRLFWRAFRRGHWRTTLGAAFSAYVFITLIESFFQIAIMRIFGPSLVARSLVSLPLGLSMMVLGGFIAEWLHRGAANALAVIVAVIIIVLMITMGDATPRWYQIIFLVFGPIAALTGGTLSRRRPATSTT